MKKLFARAWARYAAVAVVTVMVVVPATAIAGHDFADVPDSNIFHDDISWMLDNGITSGCGDGTNYCPQDNVTRQQMAAFMRRLATKKVVDAKTAITAETATTAGHAITAETATTAGHATTADSATTAGDSDKLDGLDSTAFLLNSDAYTKAETDAKFTSTATISVGIASFTADNDTVNWTSGCIRQDAFPNTVRGGLHLPVGATITALRGFMIDNDATDATLRLVRTDGVENTLVTVTTTSAGLQTYSADLVVPEVVSLNEYFYVEFDGAVFGHQLCGAAVEYTISPATSLLSDSTDESNDGDTVTGSD